MKLALGSIALLLLAFLALPSPIDSLAFHPAPAPALDGPFAPNRALEACERISSGEIPHPDKVLVDGEGRVYAGDDRGKIHRLTPDGRGGYRREVFAEPGGWPMQLAFVPGGGMIAANQRGGHFSIDARGRVESLDTLPGLSQGSAGAAVASDGTLYYPAHTAPAPGPESMQALLLGLEARPSGELRAYDLASGEIRTLVTDLYLPVGVALSSDEDFVAVNEFYAYRITRYWLKGPRAGTWDRLAENLPAIVDGIASDGRGTFYVSMPSPRAPLLDGLHPRPWLKNQLAKLVVALLALGVRPGGASGLVIAMDESGRVLRSFHDPEGRSVSTLTTAKPFGNALYVASVTGDWIARCPLGAQGG